MPKNQSQKLLLENFIFARAATLRVQVYSSGGRLYCPCAEPYLYVSIFLYNTCFAEEQSDIYDFFGGPGWPFGGVKNGWLLPPVLSQDSTRR